MKISYMLLDSLLQQCLLPYLDVLCFVLALGLKINTHRCIYQCAKNRTRQTGITEENQRTYCLYGLVTL